MPTTNILIGDLILGQATDAGRTGKNNEDSYAVFEVDWQDDLRVRQVQVAVVCDGIGGNNAGEVASKVAVEKVCSLMISESTMPIPERMVHAVRVANQDVFDTAQNSPVLRGMGTTIVMAAIDGETLYVVHAGDSRAYLVRNGKAYRLTLDHTWAQEAIDHGVLTPEKAKVHPNRNVIKRYLGVDETVAVDSAILDISQSPSEMEGPGKWPTVPQLTLLAGDTVLLCSDGLTDEISDEELQGLVRKHNPQDAADRLVALANEHGGRDNITVTLLRLPGGAPLPAAAAASPGRLPAPAPAAAASRSRLPLVIGIVALLALLATAAALLLRPDPVDDVQVTPAPLATAVASQSPPPGETAAPPSEATASSAAVAPTAPALPTTSGPLTVTAALELQGTPVNGPPTSTPVATHTPVPTATQAPLTPTPTRVSVATPTRAGVASPQPTGGAIVLSLTNPGAGDSSSTTQMFEWTTVAGALAANQAFELRFWRAGQDPVSEGFSPTGFTTQNRQFVNLQAADAAGLIDPGEYLWGVLLVETTPTYRALRPISDARVFRYERAGGGTSPTEPPP